MSVYIVGLSEVPGGYVVKHLAVQMEIVYRVIFKHVLQVYPHRLAYFQRNLVFSSVAKCHAIDTYRLDYSELDHLISGFLK